MFTKDKPLLKRRTFWKGVLVGMLLTAAIAVGAAAVLIANEPQLVSYAGVQPTFEPEFCEDTTQVYLTPTDLNSGEWCDPRFAEFKDCVPFYDDLIPPGYSTPHGPRGFLPYHPQTSPDGTPYATPYGNGGKDSPKNCVPKKGGTVDSPNTLLLLLAALFVWLAVRKRF